MGGGYEDGFASYPICCSVGVLTRIHVVPSPTHSHTRLVPSLCPCSTDLNVSCHHAEWCVCVCLLPLHLSAVFLFVCRCRKCELMRITYGIDASDGPKLACNSVCTRAKCGEAM